MAMLNNQLVYYKQLTKWDEPPFTVYCLVIKPGMVDATVSARDRNSIDCQTRVLFFHNIWDNPSH